MLRGSIFAGVEQLTRIEWRRRWRLKSDLIVSDGACCIGMIEVSEINRHRKERTKCGGGCRPAVPGQLE